MYAAVSPLHSLSAYDPIEIVHHSDSPKLVAYAPEDITQGLGCLARLHNDLCACVHLVSLSMFSPDRLGLDRMSRLFLGHDVDGCEGNVVAVWCETVVCVKGIDAVICLYDHFVVERFDVGLIEGKATQQQRLDYH